MRLDWVRDACLFVALVCLGGVAISLVIDALRRCPA